MKLTRVLAIAAIATTVVHGGAVAQSDSGARVPAEFPPSSYTGRQYVDSRGCVFIRAGIDGQTTWVPRVTRGRKVICGFKPSQTQGTATAAARPAPAQPEPEVITVPQQPAAAPKPAPTTRRVATAPKKVVRPAPASKPAAPSAAATSPKIITVSPRTAAAPKPAPKPAPKTRRVVQSQPACPGASAISQRYVQSRPGLAVRCGPQTTPHANVISGGSGTGTAIRVVTATPAPQTRPAPTSVVRPGQVVTPRDVPSPPVRVAPRHVYERQVSSTRSVFVPEGYQPVWEDDRLNPQRAHQTFAGKAMMEVAWTKTVPRRLIDRRTGREVTHNYPGLQYPYTSFEQQRAAGVIVATRGQMVPDPITFVRGRDGQVRTVKRTRNVAKTAPPRETVKPTVSTRSSAPKAPAKAASHRYVQVGIFSAPDLARSAAQRLANAGLPARMGKTTHKGQPYTSVVVGPFGTQSQLQSGMRAVRRAGYPNAYFRK
ncbi:SPOR domain-containing protein [Roseovarius sp. SK2]|uniref:SPOR domain-containing protein n=1 Tax=Roseovarius TaxID=74030 RepID=UPI00237B9DE5|nr:SPOR domain-containing protein [Roseovarius sp. SK2]MDD9726337.1 SPOR domain-containing protein [Roseovarius sp. SK2]